MLPQEAYVDTMGFKMFVNYFPPIRLVVDAWAQAAE